MANMRLPASIRSACLATLVLCSWATDARADVIDPAEEVCSKAGETCTLDGRDGACEAQICSRLDYGNPDPDGTPGTKDYECVRCVVGAKVAEPAPPPTVDPPPDAKAEPRPDDVEAEPMPQGGAAPKPTDPPKVATKGTRCTVEPTTTSMLSFALGLGLLGLAVRRRR